MAIGQGFGSDEWFWELVNRLRNERPSAFPKVGGISVRTSTQLESLILAQSERWRQA
jgi:hypothetical protein